MVLIFSCHDFWILEHENVTDRDKRANSRRHKGSKIAAYFSQVILPSTACGNGSMGTMFDLIRDNHPNTSLSTVQRRYFNETSGTLMIR